MLRGGRNACSWALACWMLQHAASHAGCSAAHDTPARVCACLCNWDLGGACCVLRCWPSIRCSVECSTGRLAQNVLCPFWRAWLVSRHVLGASYRKGLNSCTPRNRGCVIIGTSICPCGTEAVQNMMFKRRIVRCYQFPVRFPVLSMKRADWLTKSIS